MTTAASIHEQQEHRAREWHGLRPARGTTCPRYAAGKHCQFGSRDECICTRNWHVLDHARAWLDSNGRRVVTAEPYDASGDEIAALASDLDEIGLQVTVTGASPWNPGHTFMLLITTRRPL